MHLILNPHNDPAFNLALEEYLLTQTRLDLIMLWRNSKAVIIGSNQNAVEEIDMDYVRDNNIAVIRRLTGGGAVFHDLGNINYTIIHQSGDGDFGGYEKFTAPVLAYLQTLGVNASFGGRNDLVIDDKKFSGNAQTVKNGRIMHHGCILFNADFGDLGKALKPKTDKIESKGIKSVRSRVTNVHSHLPQPMSAEEFFEGLAGYFRANAGGVALYELTAQDIATTRKLVEVKYSTWEWNFGKSPAYNWENSRRYPFGTVEARLNVSGGVIKDASLYGDFFGVRDKSALEARLKGVRHHREAIAGALDGIETGEYIYGMSPDELLELLY